jgi:hypothetical protein
VAVATGFALLAAVGASIAATTATSLVNDPGGTVLSGRDLSIGGSLGVTFDLNDTTLFGGDYNPEHNPIDSTPLFKNPDEADLTKFWDNYTEELTTAGVDFIAAVGRGHRLNEAPPSCCGDLRSLTGLVDAIKRNDLRLKIAVSTTLPRRLPTRRTGRPTASVATVRRST